jgi:hypothetical protein
MEGVSLLEILIWVHYKGRGKFVGDIFRLFVILSLTQLYRYTPEIFLFSTATFKYNYRVPSDKLDKNSQQTWLIKNFSQ